MDQLLLEKNILNTLSWFDIFHHPLNAFEIWRNLYQERADGQKTTLFEVIEQLEQEREKIKKENGYFFLAQKENLFFFRQSQFLNSEKKFKKARKIIQILSFFPFVRMIALCNTLGFRASEAEGDIDLFVIAENQHIWLVRFLLVSFLAIFNLRPKGNKRKDKFCLSFFLEPRRFALENIKKSESDIYLCYWISQLWPIYDEGVCEDFWQKNLWIKKYLPQAEKRVLNPVITVKNGYGQRIFKKSLEKIFNWPGAWLEKVLENWQKQHLPDEIKNKLQPGSAEKSREVVIEPGMIKLHTNDRRVLYSQLWEQKILSL